MTLKFSISLSAIIFFLYAQAFSQTPANAILRGQLLRFNGKPCLYTEIELVPIEALKLVVDPRLVATTNSSGKFTFFNVPNGRYTLSINFDDKPTELSPYSTFFYPSTERRSEAEVFEVKDHKLIKTVSFRLPPALIERKITGKVILKNGTPVEGAYIYLRDYYIDIFFDIGRFSSGKNGEFSIQGFEGRKYQIGALLYEKRMKPPDFDPGMLLAASETDIFELTAKTTELTLVLSREKGFERLPDKYVGQTINK